MFGGKIMYDSYLDHKQIINPKLDLTRPRFLNNPGVIGVLGGICLLSSVRASLIT
jgi:hypothetical protein